MARSKREIPHYYLRHTIDMQPVSTWLAAENAHRAPADRLLPAALLLKAVAAALWEVPELNGYWIDGKLDQREPVHLGTAIALRGGGVIAPAILDAADKSVDQIMRDLRDLVMRARAGRLRSSEMTESTITVTSLGERAPETVFGVIYPPQVALVGFGGIVTRPWVVGDQVVPRPLITATLSADHRATDGHRGGIFLTTIERLLGKPDEL